MFGEGDANSRILSTFAHRILLTLSVISLLLGPLLSFFVLENSSAGHTWAIQIVDDTLHAVGRYSSIKIDSQGRPHISYVAAKIAGGLKHAYWNGIGWVLESVDSSMQPYSGTSLALDSLDRPHISYYDDDNQDLRYAHWNGTGWEIEVVDSFGDVGQDSSLDVDSKGRPHITYSFFQNSKWQIRYAYWNESSWDFHDLNYSNWVGGGHLVLDSSDTPHMSFRDEDSGDMMYAQWNGSDWVVGVVDTGGSFGDENSIALDPLDGIHIAYYAYFYSTKENEIRYASRTGTTWTIETAWMGGSTAFEGVSLDIDSQGNPGIAFIKPHTGDLLYTWKSNSQWYNETVDPAVISSVGSPSLAFDQFGSPHISYCYDSATTDLFYASVVPPPLPDLTISGRDIILEPSSPVLNGTSVNITATIHNIGGVGASGVEARFYDGRPPSAVQINGDQSIGTIGPLSSANAMVQWTASPPGMHEICVLADPDDVIMEFDETNNMACVAVEVLSLPDLTPKSIDVAPPSPMLENTVVQVNVTVANEGDISAGAFDIVLFDDVNGNTTPDLGEEIATRPLSGLGGHSQTSESFSWTASPSGAHSLCAFVDPPPGAVNESNETNNVKCTTVLVQPGPVTKPDYVPILPEPPPPIRVGLSLPVSLSIVVHNQGNATASNDSTLAFYNESSPANPFASFNVSAVPPSGNSSRFTATWTSPALPGTYNVTADVDHWNNVTEWDETNNLYTWTIEVVRGPVTSLVIGSPNYTSVATYVTSSTLLSLSVIDQGGSGINYTKYRIDNVTWIDYTGTPFFLAGEKDHYVEYYSEDSVGNVEDVTHRVLRVDDTPPATNLLISDPKHLVGGNFTTSSTPITLQATDGGTIPVGVGSIRYQVDGGGWNDYASPFFLAGEGTRTVEYYSRDLLTNEETVHSVQIVVDNAPPASSLSIGDPKYLIGGNFIKSSTPLTLHADDGGIPPVGTNDTFYRLWNGTWSPWRGYASSFTLIGRDGTWFVEFLSFDFLGNGEGVQNVTIVLDNTPPSLSIDPEETTVLVDTHFSISADDAQGSGVASVEYRTDGGEWTPYSSPFALGVGHHLIDYRSSDNLNNSVEGSLSVNVVAPETPPEGRVEVNYKPLIALLFSILIAVSAAYSSKRRPLSIVKDRKRKTLLSWAILGIPFVGAEAATGILSLYFEPLGIPPVAGWGTGVDVSILVAGIVFLLLRLARRKGTKPKPQGYDPDMQSR